MRYSCSLVLLVAIVTVAPAPVRAQAPSAAAKRCGDGLLDAGENCKDCPADCAPQACTPSTSHAVFEIKFVPPLAPDVTTTVLRVAYRSDRLSLPGAGTEAPVRARIKPSPGAAMVVANDLDYAVRVVVSGSTALPPGVLFTLEFDGCNGAPAPSAADLSCAVEACANSSGPTNDCHCVVASAKP